MNYATIKKFDIANGLGVRVSIFVSGCSHHCEGCFNEIAWDFNYGDLYTDKIEEDILDACSQDYIQGLSLLGGEPFEKENQIGLITLLRKFKKRYPEKNIWCYSGYTWEEITSPSSKIHTEVTQEMLSYIDILVDGEFVLALKDISLKFKGSSNQRIIDVQKSLKEKKIVLDPLNN